MKIIISILAVVLIIGVYFFIKDREIKKELSTVEKSEFVDSKEVASKDIASEIAISRTDGVWNITSTDSEYVINPESLKFEFTGYKLGGQHVGTFNSIVTKISLDTEGNPVSANFVFDPTSVKTDAEGVDTHLQAPEFFDTKTYPQVTAIVKEIKKENGETRAITDLIMKGVTKTLSIPVTIAPTDSGLKFAIDARITISDYNIAYGPVQDEVRVVLEAEISKI